MVNPLPPFLVVYALSSFSFSFSSFIFQSYFTSFFSFFTVFHCFRFWRFPFYLFLRLSFLFSLPFCLSARSSAISCCRSPTMCTCCVPSCLPSERTHIVAWLPYLQKPMRAYAHLLCKLQRGRQHLVPTYKRTLSPSACWCFALDSLFFFLPHIATMEVRLCSAERILLPSTCNWPPIVEAFVSCATSPANILFAGIKIKQVCPISCRHFHTCL